MIYKHTQEINIKYKTRKNKSLFKIYDSPSGITFLITKSKDV